MLLHQQSPPQAIEPPRMRQKRKADTQDNERLSKRLSLLNLERGGTKLYVPVENPAAPSTPLHALPSSSAEEANPSRPPASPDDDMMRLDDTKHKVYIYNIDDELSSSDSEHDDGRLVFLPDIEKHLRANRLGIPPAVPPNSEGQLAGMQLVLYNAPASLTVPEEQDSVRKAIIESRARFRERQRAERESATASSPILPPFIPPLAEAQSWGMPADDDPDAMDLS